MNPIRFWGVVLVVSVSSVPPWCNGVGPVFAAEIAIGGTAPGSVSLLVSGKRAAVAWIVDSTKREPGGVFAAVSVDGGATFGESVAASPAGVRVTAMGGARPGLAFQPDGGLFVSYTGKVEGGMEVHLSRLPVAGAAEDWVVAKPEKEQGYQMLPDVACGMDGGVAVAWTASGESEEGSAYVAYSSDGGRTFDKKIGLPGVACPCCPGTLVMDSGGACYFGYRAVFSGERDPVVSVVRNRGENVEGPIRIHRDHWKVDGCPANGVALAITEPGARPRIAAAWYAGGPNPGVYRATGVPGTELVLDKLKAGTTERAMKNPSIGLGGKDPGVLWLEQEKGKPTRLFSGRGGGIVSPAASFARGDATNLAAWVESGRAGNVIQISELPGGRR